MLGSISNGSLESVLGDVWDHDFVIPRIITWVSLRLLLGYLWHHCLGIPGILTWVFLGSLQGDPWESEINTKSSLVALLRDPWDHYLGIPESISWVSLGYWQTIRYLPQTLCNNSQIRTKELISSNSQSSEELKNPKCKYDQNQSLEICPITIVKCQIVDPAIEVLAIGIGSDELALGGGAVQVVDEITVLSAEKEYQYKCSSITVIIVCWTVSQNVQPATTICCNTSPNAHLQQLL